MVADFLSPPGAPSTSSAWETAPLFLSVNVTVPAFAVGPALCLAHDEADDRADRLSLAGSDPLRGVGVGLDRGLHDPRQLVVAGQSAQSLGVDDRCRVSPLGDQPVKHLLGGSRAHG